jgi:hypothetical protein
MHPRNYIKNEEVFQRLCSLNFRQFDELENRMLPLWEEQEQKALNEQKRIRQAGGGNSYKLSFQEMLFMTLLYLKQYSTQEHLATQFGINQSNVSRIIAEIHPLIEQAADPSLQTYLPDAMKYFEDHPDDNFEQLTAKFSDLKGGVSCDATEQRINRSKDNETQKKHYSGKRKHHSLKYQIIVAQDQRILAVSESHPGSVHDKRILEQDGTILGLDKRIPIRLDLGYKGVDHENPELYIILPHKKPKNGELTPLEKELNTAHSRMRIVAEHAICRIKQFRIADSKFRQPLHLHNQTIRNIVAILNFKKTFS